MLLRLLALLLVLPAMCVQAQYRWTEADGRVSYGDQPPRDAQNVQRLNPASAGADAGDSLAALPFEIRRAAREFPLVFYARADCAVCDTARGFLKGRAVPFVERSVVSHEDIEAFRQLGGGEQLPVLAVGRQMLRGFQANAWSEALDAAGYPQGVPLPRNWQWPGATPLVAPTANAPAESGQASAPGEAR